MTIRLLGKSTVLIMVQKRTVGKADFCHSRGLVFV
jgi:hypothetical protein